MSESALYDWPLYVNDTSFKDDDVKCSTYSFTLGSIKENDLFIFQDWSKSEESARIRYNLFSAPKRISP